MSLNAIFLTWCSVFEHHTVFWVYLVSGTKADWLTDWLTEGFLAGIQVVVSVFRFVSSCLYVEELWGPPGWYHKLVYWDRLLFTSIPLKKNGVILSYLHLYLYFICWMQLHYLIVCRYADIQLPLFLVDNLSFSQYLSYVIWGFYNCVEHSDLH